MTIWNTLLLVHSVRIDLYLLKHCSVIKVRWRKSFLCWHTGIVDAIQELHGTSTHDTPNMDKKAWWEGRQGEKWEFLLWWRTNSKCLLTKHCWVPANMQWIDHFPGIQAKQLQWARRVLQASWALQNHVSSWTHWIRKAEVLHSQRILFPHRVVSHHNSDK